MEWARGFLPVGILLFLAIPLFTSFAYIAVTPTQKGKTVWLKPVTEKEYNAVK